MRCVFYFYRMHGFVKEVINKIIVSDGTDISKVIIILPNKRSRIFLKQEISRIVKKTIFSPIIYDIESFMSIVSGLDKISDSELLFEFYSIYLNQTKKEEQQTFEEFISWAKTLLKDFSCLLYTSPSPRDLDLSRMPSSA